MRLCDNMAVGYIEEHRRGKWKKSRKYTSDSARVQSMRGLTRYGHAEPVPLGYIVRHVRAVGVSSTLRLPYHATEGK